MTTLQHEDLSILCDNLEICLLLLDKAQKIVFASWQAKAILHINNNIFLNDILDETAYFVCNETIKHVKENNESVINKINYNLDGELIPLDFCFFEFQDYIAICINIPQKKQMSHSSLISLEEKLSAINRLSDGIAHNLKSPLMALSGIADYMVLLSAKWDALIEGSCSNCPLQEEKMRINKVLLQMRDDIKNNVTVMADIISHLRAYNKVDRINQFVSTRLEDLLLKTIKVMQYNTKLAVEINFIKPETKLPEIFCNPSDIQVVFTNIIENAIEQILSQGQKSGIIEIKVKVMPHHVAVKIKDNGGGIAKELLETSALFEPFITTKKNEGTGLGLHSSFKIIKEHKGNIYARNHKSKIGTGAEFVVVLPLKEL